MLNYDTSNIHKCEYVEAMKKIYASSPEHINNKCKGFFNPYNKKASLVCAKCKHFIRGDSNDFK